ncbi:hypothetical protein A3J78_01755 [Candidatus Beckwithbacteria bacterium RBG_13_35_6]|uniref:Metallo-beta-lactamase domain-containing protein n=1 Tax=Candidatus Beckwithbacteria bacterium RBG_13_35_6 TaxID=1797456 RepID=A0A1F5DHJ1_9BACT|nr:MAG: hypothetical protein A3J78_01755 [Candidatus Beckwithbacteria bacterium RBG_13_35_6]
MAVEILVVGQLGTNCYLVYDKDSRDCFILDPGDDADFIIRKIQDLKLKPKAILATHGHFDHVLAVTELKLTLKIPFYLHCQDNSLLKRATKTAKYFTNVNHDPVSIVDKYLRNNQILKAGRLGLKVLETPGHTQGSISFLTKGCIFVGDVIFSNGSFGRTDLEGGDYKALRKSIKKILFLPSDSIIYPGHGEVTTVKEERKYYTSLLK